MSNAVAMLVACAYGQACDRENRVDYHPTFGGDGTTPITGPLLATTDRGQDHHPLTVTDSTVIEE